MGRQFPDVSCIYGAPMGRHSDPSLADIPRSIRLFRVRLDSGGYDDGGAYWGIGEPLWCAIDCDGGMQFTRAISRRRAAFMLDISQTALKSPLSGWSEYAFAMLDGRCPMPAGKDRFDVIDWMRRGGISAGSAA